MPNSFTQGLGLGCGLIVAGFLALVFLLGLGLAIEDSKDRDRATENQRY